MSSVVSPAFEKILRLQQQGQNEAAIAGYQDLLKLEPNAQVYANLGVALRTKGHMEAALVCYEKSLAMQPEQVGTLSNLGGGLRALGRLQEALTILEKALQLDPDFIAAHYNLGLVYMDSQEPQKAIAAFDEVLKRDPDRVDARFDRATCILQTGDLALGFAEYECRSDYEPRLKRAYTQPRWQGESLTNKTLLVYAEQGFGDTLQFCRYLPLIQKEGGRIILECPSPLTRLMEQSFDCLDAVVSPESLLPSFDYHIPLLSLPAFFHTTLETIPKDIPYLKAPIATKPAATQSPIKVGLVWGNGHMDVGVRHRSIPLEQFAPLLSLPNMAFYSFQKGQKAKDLKRCGFDALVKDLDPFIQDFADTAAYLSQMDLLISVDTAIVHCAGALNIPCWVLLPYGSEWRWLLERDDSAWYKSLRLFRLGREDDWHSVLETICSKLKDFSTK
jgi:tetratricopeptide (TPR) repeat protein